MMITKIAVDVGQPLEVMADLLLLLRRLFSLLPATGLSVIVASTLYDQTAQNPESFLPLDLFGGQMSKTCRGL